VHVTLRARDALPSLRSPRLFGFVQRSLAAAHKVSFRVVHFSVQTDHLHLVVEGDDPVALVRGVQGLAVRCAKAVNRAVGRRGNVWSSRYHSRALRNPTETRHGLVYVLLNHRKHLRAAPSIDPRSSGRWFDGWERRPTPPTDAGADSWRPTSPEPSPVAPARTWLARVGWRLAGGGVALDERPRPAPRGLVR
jgi:REP element-mobilizing transposase RayT